MVLAILGILVLLATPNYLNYLTKTRRVDGQTALLDLANQLQRYYLIHQSYETATIASNNPQSDVLSQAASPQGWYHLQISAQSQNQYSLEAQPQGAQAKADQQCQTLTINHLGELGSKNGSANKPTGTTHPCWH